MILLAAKRSSNIHESCFRRRSRTANQISVSRAQQTTSVRLDSRSSKWYFFALSKLQRHDSSQTEYLRRSQSSAWSAVAVDAGGWRFTFESNEVSFNFSWLKIWISEFLFLFQLHQEAHRRHECRWRWTKVVAVLQLGEPPILASPSHRTSLALRVCLLARHASSHRVAASHSSDWRLLAASSNPQCSNGWDESSFILWTTFNSFVLNSQEFPKTAKAYSTLFNATDWTIKSEHTSASNVWFSCSARVHWLSTCSTQIHRFPDLGPAPSNGCTTNSIVSVALLVSTTTARGHRRLSRMKIPTVSSSNDLNQRRTFSKWPLSCARMRWVEQWSLSCSNY